MPGGIRRRKLAKSGFNSNIKRRAKKEKKKRYDFGNPLIAANWDSKLTVQQNYRRLGLAPNTKKASGGVADKEADHTEVKTRAKAVATARIVRDAEGNTRVEYAPEDDIDEPVVPVAAKTDVVRQLEAQAAAVPKRKRHLSEEERKWLAKLVAKHGDNFKAMQWDRKLNPFQHSERELSRRVAKLKEE